VVAVAYGGEHRDRLAVQPPDGEGQDVAGRGVDPLDVVQHDQQGRPFGHLGQQGQDGDTRQQGVGVAGLEPEGPAQRPALPVRQVARLGQHRPQEPVQSRERQILLGLVTGRAQHPPARRRGAAGGVVQQGALARSPGPGEDQGPPAGHVRHQGGEPLDHGVPPDDRVAGRPVRFRRTVIAELSGRCRGAAVPRAPGTRSSKRPSPRPAPREERRHRRPQTARVRAALHPPPLRRR
jgi:hypothetical protein